jgi:hypothetical protein
MSHALYIEQYLLVLDAINFCFWPSEGMWEYDALARSLKDVLTQNAAAFSAENLMSLDEGGCPARDPARGARSFCRRF